MVHSMMASAGTTGTEEPPRNESSRNACSEAWKDRHKLQEWSQPNYTCETGAVHSRIDRVYVNQHLGEQLDRECSSVTLKAPPFLSDHSLLSFARRTPKKARHGGRHPLPTWALNHEEYPALLQEIYEKMTRRQTLSPLDKVDMMKQAMRKAVEVIREKKHKWVAHSREDQLSTTMRMWRAVEKNDTTTVSRCLTAYADLARFVSHPTLRRVEYVDMPGLRDHALHLASATMQDRIQELKEAKDTLSEPQYQQSKENILVKLKRLIPGGSSGSLSAVRSKHGLVSSDPKDMADWLTEHWGGVFSAKVINKRKLRQRLEASDYSLRVSADRWKILEEHVAAAIKYSNNSAPGPDGIPYLAWRRASELALPVLLEAVEHLHDDRTKHSLPYLFNEAFLACLPKKPSGTDECHGTFYDAKSTRPLSIVNTDNRLMAASLRCVFEPIAMEFVSAMQRGFVRNRSILMNVLDIDFESMKVSLKHSRGALVLFDFEAAFPSLSHEYLFETLSHIGVPTDTLAALKCFYINNVHTLRVKGQSFPSVVSKSGIRQGCPLSPLLFVIVVDVLLRRLQSAVPECTLRAFADDNGMVIPDLAEMGPTIMTLYKEFGEISNLRLNMSKTVVIPLWSADIDSLRKGQFARQHPEWAEADLATHGTYLGFVLGPGREDSVWSKPQAK